MVFGFSLFGPLSSLDFCLICVIAPFVYYCLVLLLYDPVKFNRATKLGNFYDKSGNVVKELFEDDKGCVYTVSFVRLPRD